MQRIVINGIPVFRGFINGSGNVYYQFFEEGNSLNEIHLDNKKRTMVEEYQIVLEFICELTGHNSKHVKGIRVGQIDLDFARSFYPKD